MYSKIYSLLLAVVVCVVNATNAEAQQRMNKTLSGGGIGIASPTAGYRTTVSGPAPITGSGTVCVGSNTTLSDVTAGGSWTSNNAAIASVGAGSGVVTGMAVGSAVISYTTTAGTSTMTVVVNPLPNAYSVTGGGAYCAGGAGVHAGLSNSASAVYYQLYFGGSVVGSPIMGVTGSAIDFGLFSASGVYSVQAYNASTGCANNMEGSVVVLVNPTPAPISGSTSVCTGSAITMTDATAGGSWTSNNPAIANIGATSGVLAGVAAGSATITYSLSTTGCYVTQAAVVNPLPGSISGATTVAVGSTITLGDVTPAGVWSSENAAVAQVGATNGVVTGMTAGSVRMSYTLPTGCFATTIINVSAATGGGITGTLTVCAGNTTTLSSTTTGGSWASGNPTVATVSSATGIVTGVSAGTSIITYTTAAGLTTAVVTVYALPAAITGTSVLCSGANVTLADATTGGSWISGGTAIATITPGAVVTGVSPGTAEISYLLPTGCFASRIVTVNPLPYAMAVSPASTALACLGTGTVFTASASSATVMSQDFNSGLSGWTINNIAGEPSSYWQIRSSPGYSSATPGDGSALMEAASDAGGSGVNTNTILVSPSFSLAGYVSATLTLNEYYQSWSAGDTTVSIEYSINGGASWLVIADRVGGNYGTTSWSAGAPTTIIAMPGTALGQPNVKLRWRYNSTFGYYWAIDNVLVTGNTASLTYGWLGIGGANGISCATCATTTINPTTTGVKTYSVSATNASGCTVYSGVTVTVNPIAAAGAISGPSTVCAGGGILLTNTATGGVWSSSDTGNATISETGTVTGVAAGTVVITYTVSGSCGTAAVIKTLTVVPLPDAGTISGTGIVCQGTSITLSASASGGSWSSGSGSVAGVSASGIVTGFSGGTALITYAVTNSCGTSRATMLVTVIPTPTAAAITGVFSTCAGSSTTLSDATPGGSWSSSNTTVATIDGGGVVAGLVAGTSTITYSVTNSCATATAIRIITVNPLPVPGVITGAPVFCAAATTALASTITGGTWSSGNTSVATANSGTGVISGIAAGTAIITYTKTNSCGIAFTTISITVNPLPVAGTITGTPVVCPGAVTTLASTLPGGTWISSNTTKATVAASGAVTGVAAGTSRITYTASNGCGSAMTTVVVTVNALPYAGAITGTRSVCEGGITTLANTATGGSWISENTDIATVDGTGVVSGQTAGTVVISYAVTNGCATLSATAIVTVNATPDPIAGTLVVCASSTTALADAVAGGTWTSSMTTVASVGGTGLVSGVGAGTATISYTMPGNCRTTAVVTVNAIPNVITGATSVCEGATTTLADATVGGSWSSSNPAMADVNTTGVVNGIAAGTVTIAYTLSTGCARMLVVSVSASPAAIGGSTMICAGAMATLSDVTPGGTWSSGTGSVASVGATTGVLTGVTAGTARISYSLPSGCRAIVTATVNPVPAAITGTASVCTGFTTTLGETTTGGSWTSDNTDIATINAGSGVVTGITGGTVVMTYSVGTGCYAIKVVTVNTLPAAITGALAVCAGATTTLTDATVPATSWASSNTAVATINTTSGIVTALTAGTTTITYTINTGCRVLAVVTVNPLPAAISGVAKVCIGQTTTLTNSTTGGSWYSGNTTIATIDADGVVLGAGVGTVAVTYMLPTGCIRSVIVTVNPIPSPITGVMSVCAGSATTLNSATMGGTWTSSNAAVATINSTTRVVTGIGAGSATISYTLATGCFNTATVNVTELSTPITGTSVYCPGTVATLSNITPGGTWSSSNAGVASVGISTGIVSGVAGGTATITYNAGCTVRMVVTVNPLPAAITGSLSACLATTTSLSTTTTGGTWSSDNTAVATVGASGNVFGVDFGTATISYLLPTGCARSVVVTVNASPDMITGTTNACTGTTTTLSNTQPGGTWTSSTTTVATVTSVTGVVTGVAAGTAIITYKLTGSGCMATTIVSVGALPAAITGAMKVCPGTTITLSDATTGGSWTSSNDLLATVDPLSGVVSGVSAGTPIITYMAANGCVKTAAVTVNPLPGAITGATLLCVGQTSLLNSTTSGGAWSSSNAAVVSINTSTHVVTGVSVGTATISYSLSTGCFATVVVTVSTGPAAIAGGSAICPGTTTTLTDATPSGSWSSSNTAIATIGAADGIVTGVAGGTVTISYIVGSGCAAVKVLTINTQPAAIGGLGSACAGATTGLTDATTGGTWSSANTDVATINTSGLVTGVSAGTAIISYTIGTGCAATKVVTINAMPSVIGGSLNVCIGQTTTLSNTVTGGTWSSIGSVIATASATGIVTGLTAGTAIVTYSLSTGCKITAIVTVASAPAAITGTLKACIGATTTLNDASPGGTWVSGNTSVATVDVSAGIVTGVAAGTATISYIVGAGCSRTTTVTINGTPSDIQGVVNLCVGATSLLTDTTGGGMSWSSSNTAVATINSLGGFLTGVSAGTTTITYLLGTGCYVTVVATINALPTAILGTLKVCAGFTTSLSDANTGGTWVSANATVATIGTSSGVVTGVAAGTTTISYILGSAGCVRTAVLTVNPQPMAITGYGVACVGTSTTLNDGSGPGSWASGNTGVATVSPVGGVVTGVAGGTALISYVLNTGCYVTITATINPTLPPLTGPAAICVGATTTFSNPLAGGTWSTSNNALAAIGSATGIVSGIGTGTVTITYSFGTGCISTASLTIKALPAAITGATVICRGSTTALHDASGGGNWLTSDSAIATVNTTGIVTGTGAGVVTITYQLPAGCFSTINVTVNPLNAITGTASICLGTGTSLNNVNSGGSWSSSNPSVATVTGSGFVSSIAAGTTAISYILPTGCAAALVVTVNPLPSPITGTAVLCQGATATLADATGAGTWTSTDTTVASINLTSGLLTATGGGNATITYTLPVGCIATYMVTINPLPAAIAGTLTVCTGATTSLSNATPGGSWISSVIGIATVDAAGVVTGAFAGTVTISYVLPTGCYVTAPVTVNSSPALITGALGVCEGSTTVLGSLTGGGTWSTANAGIATVGTASGVVQGVLAGNTMVTYSFATGCTATAMLTVNPQPTAIMGVASVCVGLTTSLANATPGGTWSSSNAAVATVNTSGVVAGVAAGPVTISYTLPAGCATTVAVVVNLVPNAIVGNANVCVGGTTALSDLTSGGSWASGSTAVATVDAGGIVSGITGGTSIVSYSMPSGCRATMVVTVNDLPATISGIMSVCSGSATSLSNTTPGGTWSSSNPGVATVDASGVVTGLTVGTASITYTLATGCTASAALTVNAMPSAITGMLAVCEGSITNLSNSTPGGAWSSTDATIASVDGAGHVSGVLAGTAMISYTLPAGCGVGAVVTVNAIPAAIAGAGVVCVSSAITLSDATTGGTWSSANALIATAGPATGIITGVAGGTTTITYTTAAGCVATTPVTVNPIAPVTGTLALCIASATTLSDATVGGSWTSSNAVVATVGSGSGIVSGMSTGTAELTYTMLTGCMARAVVTVNPTPSGIGGSLAVCIGATTTLTDATPGGNWSSSVGGVATINPSTGVASGLTLGNTTITYSLGAGCRSVAVLTVNPLPSAISGSLAVCSGSTTTLGNTQSGGTWASSNTTIATINTSTRIVSGLLAGTTTISYTLGTGCAISAVVTVNPLPATITGTLSACAGFTSTLSNASGGGAWSSGNTAVATIDASGIVSAIAAGTVTMSYTLPTGCISTATYTVNAIPAVITGTAAACLGATTTLSNATGGGAWSSTDMAVATIGSTGIVSGMLAGTSVISYSSGAGCVRTTVVTINPLPDPVSGTLSACVGLTTTLTDAGGGTWGSSTSTVVSVGATTGIATGVAAGTATVTYTLPTGCKTTAVVTINGSPAAITGTQKACPGTTTTLNNATSGGSWTSGNNGIATIGSLTGVVTGVAQGTVLMTYQSGAGCRVTAVVTINPQPAAIGGTLSVCAGATTALNDATTGGLSWTSSNTAVATVNASSGVVSGIAAGNSNITYTLGTGCFITATVTVNPLPAAISGTMKVCSGFVTSLSDADAGGVWNSTNASVGTINTSGVVSGIAAGTTIISYTLPTGCVRSGVLTVNSTPAAIAGNGLACIGTSTTLTDASGGGTWSSSNTGIATVLTNGAVTGAAAGTTSISYIVTATGCFVTTVVTINPIPAANSGTPVVCSGSATVLNNSLPGGTWSSSNNAFATAGAATGVVTGVAAGTANITYSFGATCRAVTTVTINAIPAAITGTPTVCVGGLTMLNDATSGGAWTSSNTTVATVGGTGIVAGATAGVTVISYTLSPTGCARSVTVTVNPSPVAGSITGAGFNINTVSAPVSVVLSATGDAGGAWSSSNTAVATVDAGGLVSAAGAGLANITYTVVLGSCSASATHTVNVTAARANNGMATTTATTNVQAMQLYPNPNTGRFVVKGTIAVADGTDAAIQVTDMLGQQIYVNKSSIAGGQISSEIVLDNNLANGMYILNMRAGDEVFKFYFSVSK